MTSGGSNFATYGNAKNTFTGGKEFHFLSFKLQGPRRLTIFFFLIDSYSDDGRGKSLGVPPVKGGQNLPPMAVIGLTDMLNLGGPVAPQFRHHWIEICRLDNF